MNDILIYGILIMVVAILAVFFWTRFRWSKLKPELFPELLEAEHNAGPFTEGGKQTERRWLMNIPAILAGVQRTLEKTRVPEEQALVEALRKVEAAAPQLPAAVRSVVTASLESAELHSLLVNSQGLYAYIVAVPNRHEHPHLIRRYTPFATGWINHASLVKASLMSSGEFSGLISYLFFLSPDDREGLLLLSYADASTELVPSRLILEAELKRTNAIPVDTSLEFKMSD
jgi:hypothetical protein